MKWIKKHVVWLAALAVGLVMVGEIHILSAAVSKQGMEYYFADNTIVGVKNGELVSVHVGYDEVVSDGKEWIMFAKLKEFNPEDYSDIREGCYLHLPDLDNEKLAKKFKISKTIVADFEELNVPK